VREFYGDLFIPPNHGGSNRKCQVGGVSGGGGVEWSYKVIVVIVISIINQKNQP